MILFTAVSLLVWFLQTDKGYIIFFKVEVDARDGRAELYQQREERYWLLLSEYEHYVVTANMFYTKIQYTLQEEW